MPRTPLYLLLILGALTAFGPMSIDMYLPSFTQIAAQLHCSMAAVQLTLAAFLVGLGIGQLLYGPLADRVGRKPPLYGGLLLYVAASIGCALATRIDVLIALRLLQGAGGCAGVVMARAMVRDLFDHQQAARMFSRLMLVMGVAPILAPLLGSYVLQVSSWRGIFWILAGFGLLCLSAARFGLTETLPPAARRQVSIASAMTDYLSLFRDRAFLAYAFAGGLAQAGMFAYIAGSPEVFMNVFHVSPSHFAWIFGGNALSLILASQLNARLLRRHTPEALLAQVNKLTAIAGIALLLAGLSGWGSMFGLWLPLLVYMASLGCVFPNSAAAALRHQGHRAGVAAALLGTLQYGTSTLAGIGVAALHDGSARPMCVVIAACGLLAWIYHGWMLRAQAAA